MVHFAVDALGEEGATLGERYHLGSYFPLFILTDSTGSPITRWAGYVGAEQFLAAFERLTRDLTTIDTRQTRMKSAPNLTDAIILARYSTDAGEYLEAMKYYQQAQQTAPNPTTSFRFPIFSAAVNAAWNGRLPFARVCEYADPVVASALTRPDEQVRLAKLMANLTRKIGHTEELGPYLKAGMAALSGSLNEQQQTDLTDLKADYALHVAHDTAQALAIKKQGLGAGWDQDVARYYAFGEFCFQRGINLEEAEQFIRRATSLASGDKFVARHLRLLSEICYAQGKSDEAIRIGEEALELDMSAAYFEERLSEMRERK